ncbi:MAG: tetratricopeptide repeat protein [Prolixibacteraceae bacterium]|jgi:TolA-binding protein|nr:tetratricopeptide repeat protein [Prolixibacteraceae bacterium]MBT6762948.1 tetratricopeptide repeat protein [Prolixibacteraceae bacterium]MBT6999489.1 tetratricopeptide repeat protein [Prolixibacteraceae bacterium]MBT7395879.1 tetratricopeptide repeat protein [Prolixibacteraceae bacterium]
MKTIRNLIFLHLLILVHLQLNAQQTAYFSDVQKEIVIAKELFGHGKFNAAFRQFEKIQNDVNEKSELFSEAEFFKSVSALKAGHSSGSKMVNKFINDFPESPYNNRAWFNLGDYQFEKKQYPNVIRSYGNVDRSDVSDKERVKLQYQTGYSHLMTDNNDLAASEFYQIKDENSLYSKPATYYWAHIMYLEENFESSLQGFSKLDGDPTYSRVIPLYVSHIYYKQQKYNEVVNYTTSIIDDVEKEHQAELSKLVGDSYFHLRNYTAAIPYLETYHENPSLKTREDNYLLGYCYYNTGSFDKSAPLLEKASKGKDEMAQNAYYHLADCYIQLNEKENARIAFEAASEFDFNERVKEDALFSYAKLTYELSYSPFNETIKAFDRYIATYPNSERNAEAYRYLVEVFMVTRNYRDAINSIEKIQVKTPAILRAYQRVTYYRGLELFNNLAYNQAVDFFDLSLKNSSHSREINASALFWKAEALYRVGDYNNSISTYNQFLRTAGAFSMPEYQDAQYNLAYSYFKLEDYEQASSLFRKYVNAMQGKRSEKLADALNRVGDYYYLETNYSLAQQNYEQAYNMKIYEADYALFQIAFCQGLQRDQQGKVNNLERLLAGFPDSDYQDDALYELGRAHERLGQNYEAAQQYQQIINRHQQGIYYRKALLQMGLINYNNGDYPQALDQYQIVAENYRGTPEAQSAMLGIKNCYVEMNNIDAYFAYANRLGSGVNVTVSEQDSLTYLSAERLYMAGDPNASAQLQRYLQQFPNGSFTLNAHFYLAESLYKEGRYSESNEHYSYAALQPDNIFSEPALSRSSELTYNAQQYSQALDMFVRLENIANSKWNILKAYTGQMRCYFNLERFPNAIEAAEKVKKSDIVNEALVRESNYITGKSYYKLDNFNLAIPGLKEVANDTKLEQGAEAKFLLSETYYRQENKTQAENEILDFISKGTPYQFWLGKAFLLLSDIYIDKGDEFQAKHTLKSVVENYGNDTDGIKIEAERKLAAIEAGEKLEQKKAIDNSLQLKLIDN